MRDFAAGDYYLGINIDGTPDRTNPYPPTYYPNTHDVREAIPLSFMGGPLTLSRDLTAPPRLPVLTLRDRVLVPNGPLEAETNVRITGSAGDYVDPGDIKVRSDGRFEFEACEGVRYRAYAFAGRYSVSRYSAEVEFTAARDLDELVLVIDKSQEEHLESSRKLGVR